MLRKPWPIIIISLIFMMLPISNIITTYIVIPNKVSFYDYILSLFLLPSNRLSLMELVLPGLIAGIATYSVKKWSYIVLLLFVLWTAISGSMELYKYYGQLNTIQILFVFVTPLLFSIVVALYFMIPTVKTTYFNKRIRWWEAKPRYQTEIKGNVRADNNEIEGNIINLSVGGVFLEIEKSLNIDETFRLKFEYDGHKIDVNAKVVFKKGDTNGYGIKFENPDPESKRNLKNIIKSFKENNVELCRPIPLWDEDLKRWFYNFLKTGKGITPEVPNQFQTKND